ncbi:hypothetical protein NM688_g764 [Phlebia brevispora]|uniref:Uncharacterized protein n=1 Tax=Phlebia brevispora TaxID=194682 RepID=A0ACC1TDK7_9APHY|nr:hypothetical protein NM688_g764 [Phlebia brevispora]
MTVPILEESKVDVLVIGAGPAGLFCANGLARAGVSVRIVDKTPEKVAAGQADGLQPRTLEVLQSYGLAERVFREGTQMHTAAFYNPSPNGGVEPVNKTADITGPSARYPFEVTLHQGNIESLFLDSMSSMGVGVDRPVTPISLEISKDEAELQDSQSYPVKVLLKHLRDEALNEVVYARFVVGADGAHSWVRKALGISMEGEQTDSIWGVLDIQPETDFPDVRRKCVVHSLNGTCGVIPREDDMVRLYIQLDDNAVLKDDGRLDKANTTPEKILQVGQNILRPYKMETKVFYWWTVYTVGQRVAAKYSAHDRVFIAGDACHTHSPKAGQGMNASMNDTHNIIWKLVYVLRGWADMSLLKTYEDERRKYAQKLIEFDKMFAALVVKKPKTDDYQEGVTHEEFLRAFQTFGEFTSGIGIHYGPSAIVNPEYQSVAKRLTIGKRILPHVFVCAADGRPYEIHDLLPADTRFKVLVFAGNTSQEAQMQRVREFADMLTRKDAFFERYGKSDPSRLFNLLIISSTSVDGTDHVGLTKAFRSHWSKVFVDDRTMYGHSGGNGYEEYGIDHATGAVVVVRPDGYVGMATPLKGVSELDAYFSGFMRSILLLVQTEAVRDVCNVKDFLCAFDSDIDGEETLV